METGLLLLGAVILVGVLGNFLFSWTRIPESLFLIAAGLLIGPILGWVPRDFFVENTSFFVTIALIIVLLNSGLNLDLRRAVRNTGYALAFTIAVFAATIAIVAATTTYFFGWPLLHGIFLGIVGSGTTTVTITHLVEKLGKGKGALDGDTRTLLIVESVVNDLTVIAGGSILLALAAPGQLTGQGIAIVLFNELVVSLLAGAVLGVCWIFLYMYRLHGNRLSYIFTVGLSLVIFFLAQYLGLNGALTVMMFSLVLGNYAIVVERFKVRTKLFEGVGKDVFSMKRIDTEFTFLIRTFFFVLLGIIFDLSVLTNTLVLTLAFAVLAAELAGRYLGGVVMGLFHKSFRKDRFIRTTMVASGVTSTLVAFLAIQAGIDIPYFAEIVLLLVVLTTVTAILGTAMQQYRSGSRET